MKIIMCMAGRGSRFHGSGYQRPKPLIEVLGEPMFLQAVRSIENMVYSQIIFIALAEHQQMFDMRSKIQTRFQSKGTLILIPEVTAGQLCTVLMAKELINSEESVLIISSDTIVQSTLRTDIENMEINCEGLISVANMPGDRWSFAKTDETGKVVEVAEKHRISDNASTGLYYFSNGKKFVQRAEKLIADQKTTKGEYFIMPLYQQYINAGEYIGISVAAQMWDLGTPDSLTHFLMNQSK